MVIIANTTIDDLASPSGIIIVHHPRHGVDPIKKIVCLTIKQFIQLWEAMNNNFGPLNNASCKSKHKQKPRFVTTPLAPPPWPAGKDVPDNPPQCWEILIRTV